MEIGEDCEVLVEVLELRTKELSRLIGTEGGTDEMLEDLLANASKTLELLGLSAILKSREGIPPADVARVRTALEYRMFAYGFAHDWQRALEDSKRVLFLQPPQLTRADLRLLYGHRVEWFRKLKLFEKAIEEYELLFTTARDASDRCYDYQTRAEMHREMHNHAEYAKDLAIAEEHCKIWKEEQRVAEERRVAEEQRVAKASSTVRCANVDCRAVESSPKLKMCGWCHTVFYCSRECQVADWGRHKKSCSGKKTKARQDDD